MPSAAIIPWMSSGVVSPRTRITGLARLAELDRAVGVEDDACPLAAPGLAFRPRRHRLRRCAGSIIGCSSWSSCAGSMRATASSREISPSSTIVDRDLQRGGRGPLRGARLEEIEPVVLDRELDVLRVAVVLLEFLHRLQQLRVRGRQHAAASPTTGSGVRMPATTSSPCAFARNSPITSGSPVEGSRVNATPVPERSPLLPKTICTMFTAVPMSSGISFALAIDLRARRLPRVEDRAHRAHQLLVRVLRELLARRPRVDLAVASPTSPARSSAVSSVSAPRLAPPSARWSACSKRCGVDSLDDLAEHLDQPPIRVEREARGCPSAPRAPRRRRRRGRG